MTTDASKPNDEVCSLIRAHRSSGIYGHLVMTLTDVFDDYRANQSVAITVRAQAGGDNRYGESIGFYGHRFGIEPRSLNGPIELEQLKVATKVMSAAQRRIDKMDEKRGPTTTMTEWIIRVAEAVGVKKVRLAFKVLPDYGYTPINWPVYALNTTADLARLGGDLAKIESELLSIVYPAKEKAA